MFTEDELSDLEFLINQQIDLCKRSYSSKADWESDAISHKMRCQSEQDRLEKLLEKVRKM